MKLLSLFTGIGAFEKALEKLDIKYDLVGFSEIDKYAIKSYCAIHNVDPELNFGDVRELTFQDIEGKVDLLTWGFPCQDISVAGKMAGIKEGTRSGLYYEGLRILKEVQPKYSIIENVKNLTSKKFKDSFEQILKDLENAGYNNYWKVLNAKNYGVPQNRERVFIVSIRKDIDKGIFEFPAPYDNGIRLKDVLEDSVDEKYFLSEKMIQGFIANNQNYNIEENQNTIRVGEVTPNSQAGQVYSTDGISPTIIAGTHGYANGNIIEAGNLHNKGWYNSSNIVYSKRGIAPTLTAMQGGNIKPKVMVERIGGIFDKDNHRHQAGSIYNREGIAPPLDTMQGGYRQPMVNVINGTKKGYDTAMPGDSINMTFPRSKTKRGRVGHGVAQTLDTSCSQATITDYRIRKLTPKECWRLMGFSDTDFEKARATGNSDTQLYKQAGNSIVVNVLEEIIKKLLNNEAKHIVSFSGGKDSTAMLLKMIERRMPIDEIIYCDTGMEFPEMYEHINKVEKYINRPITRLKAKNDFEYLMFKHIKTKGKNKGKQGYSWPGTKIRWCTSKLKVDVINKYLSKYKNKEIVEYIGIAADEISRKKDKKYPLIEFNMTEKDCLEYCYSKGFYWDGLYEKFKRLSCWCCPLKSLKELRILRKEYPELWKKLIEMDNKTYRKFRPDYSVQELDNKFAKEDHKC